MFEIKSFCLFCQRIGKRKKLENRKFSQSKHCNFANFALIRFTQKADKLTHSVPICGAKKV